MMNLIYFILVIVFRRIKYDELKLFCFDYDKFNSVRFNNDD